jgi:hypothetical protein
MTLESALTLSFWFSFIVLAYTFCGYPCVVFCFARLFRKPSSLAASQFPTISIVLAAHNEQERILPRV